VGSWFGGSETSTTQNTDNFVTTNSAAAQDRGVTTSGSDNTTIVYNQDLSGGVVDSALGFAETAALGAYAVQRAAGDNVLEAQADALDVVDSVAYGAFGLGSDAIASNTLALDSVLGFGNDALNFASDAADRAAFSQSDALGFAENAARGAAAAQSDALDSVRMLAGDQVDNISQLARDLKAGDSKLMLKALYAVGAVLALVGVVMVVK